SMTEAARTAAQPASTALPPVWSSRIPASADSGQPAVTAPRLPRTTGRKVSARGTTTIEENRIAAAADAHTAGTSRIETSTRVRVEPSFGFCGAACQRSEPRNKRRLKSGAAGNARGRLDIPPSQPLTRLAQRTKSENSGGNRE